MKLKFGSTNDASRAMKCSFWREESLDGSRPTERRMLSSHSSRVTGRLHRPGRRSRHRQRFARRFFPQPAFEGAFILTLEVFADLIQAQSQAPEVSYRGEELDGREKSALRSLVRNSTHALSRQLHQSLACDDSLRVEDYHELAGKGVRGGAGVRFGEAADWEKLSEAIEPRA